MAALTLSLSLVELAYAVGGRANVANQCAIPEHLLADWVFGIGQPDPEQWASLYILAGRSGVGFPPPPRVGVESSRQGPASSRPPRPSIEEEQPLSGGIGAKRSRRMLPISVLVVDDDPHFRCAVRELLERSGFDVDEAGNGIEALSKLTGSGLAPDLLLTDLKMPGMDGNALLAAVRASKTLGSIPAVVVSAYLPSGPVLGARKLIPKDERLESLVDDLRAIVSQRSPD